MSQTTSPNCSLLQSTSPAPRYVGLDIHKHYFVAVGLDADHNQVLGPHKVANRRLEAWSARHLLPSDRVALEVTTNAYLFHDLLFEQVHSVTVVHPPNVRAITHARVKTDKKAAEILAKLLAAGLLEGIWIPPDNTRDLRGLIAQREHLKSLATSAKNRLHAILHRRRIGPAPFKRPFEPQHRDWWEALELPKLERVRMMTDLETLYFAQRQLAVIEEALNEIAAQDERMPFLIQIPGVGLLTGLSILAAIGEIERFEKPGELVGYAGLGASVYISGQKHTTGRITKTGRKDLRSAMVAAARAAVRSHPHWKAEYERYCKRMVWQKAVVAVARRLLIVVWQVLHERVADKFGDPEKIAASLFAHAYRVGVKNLPDGMSARQFVRWALDEMGHTEIERFRWGSKWVTLPEKLRNIT